MRQPLIVGNWKMNGSPDAARDLCAGIARQTAALPAEIEIVVCPAFTLLPAARAALADARVILGAQDVAANARGAFTGQVSGEMLQQHGCRYVIVGHSERRRDCGETDAIVADKTRAALTCGLCPIICIGETLDERERGASEAAVARQLAPILAAIADAQTPPVIAYEPVWAIGGGGAATPGDAQAVHAYVRAQLREASPEFDAVRIIYGGSVTRDNAGALLAETDIDGVLVGGAALQVDSFAAICRAVGE